MKEQAKADYLRQRDWFDPAKHPRLSVTVVGAGGIGGPTCIALAKLGVPHLKVYDFDRVEAHNQPNQVYGLADVGSRKVDALAKLCIRMADRPIKYSATKVSPRTPLAGIVIGAVDSMDARRAVWDAIQASGERVTLYIDGRIGGEVIRVLTIRPENRLDRARYQRTIVPNHAVAPMKCTQAGIIDVSFAIASLITRSLRLNLENPKYSDLFFDHRNLTFLKG